MSSQGLIQRMSSSQNVAFGAKLVTLCVVLGVSLLGIGTGFLLNAYVYASRTWLPEQAVFSRPLHFDYNETHAVATAQFIKWHQSPNGHMLAPRLAKFLKDGQNADVTVELDLPDRQENTYMFILRCDLLSDSGAQLVEARRALMMPHRSVISKTCRNVLLLPLYLAGLLSEIETVRVPHLVQYKERHVAPLGGVRVMLFTQKREIPLPLVQQGTVRVDVNRSWWQSLLALFRLNSVLHVFLFIIATSLMLLSTGAAVCALALGGRSIVAFCLAPISESAPSCTAAMARTPAAHVSGDSGSLTFAETPPDSIREQVEARVQKYGRNPMYASSDGDSIAPQSHSSLSDTLNRLTKRVAEQQAETGGAGRIDAQPTPSSSSRASARDGQHGSVRKRQL